MVFQTKYGWIAISSTSKGLCFLVLPEADDALAKQKIITALDMKYGKVIESEEIIHKDEYYSDSEGRYLLKKAREELTSYFDGKKLEFTVPVDMEGYTQFQKNVWNEVCRIPYGYTCNYGYIARQIGKPKASRAVGQALKKNPVLIIIPCHRVISSDRKIGGFSGGIQWKKKLLDLESLYHFNTK